MSEKNSGSRRSGKSSRRKRTSSFVKGQRKEFGKRVVLLGILIPAIFAGLFALIWFNREDQQAPGEISSVIGPETPFEELMRDGTLVDLKLRADQIARNVVRYTLPEKVSQLNDRIEIAKRMEELAINEDDDGIRQYAQMAQIDSMVLLDALNVIHELGEMSYREQLLEFTTPLLDSEYKVVRSQAHIGLTQVFVQHFIYQPTDENFDQLYEQMQKSVPYIVSTAASAASFEQMMAMIYGAVPDSDTDERVRKLQLYVGNEFRKSDDPIVWRLGTAIHNRMVVGDVNFTALANVVSIGEETAIRDVEEMVEAVAESGLAGRGVYLELVKMCEGMVHTGHGDKGDALLKRLEESIPDIKEELTRVEVGLIFQRRTQRNELLGTKFDLSGKDVLENEISGSAVEGKAVVVVFFSMGDPDSQGPVSRMGDYSHYAESGIEFVAACRDPEKNPEGYQRLIEMLPDVVFTDSNTGGEYMKRCPVTYVPYIIILDRQHNIVQLNPDMEDLRDILSTI